MTDIEETKPIHKPLHASWIAFAISIIATMSFIFIIHYVIPLALGAFDSKYHTPINKGRCYCSCFDGLNKGRYGRGRYKSVYWNMEKETFIIMGIWFLYFLIFMRTVESVVNLLLEKKLNFIWFFLLLCSIQPTFYGMWMMWNYINDRIYHLFFHQIYFTITEMINFIVIYLYLDKSNRLGENLLWITLAISSVHVLQSIWDQGLTGILAAPLDFFMRDMMFLIGDVPLVVLSMLHLHWITPWKERIVTQRVFIIALIIGMIGTITFLSNVTYGG
jgi:hypothetical protein